MIEECFRKQEYCIVEFSMVQKDYIRAAASLFKSSVKDFDAVFIRKHVSFDYEQEELVDIHKTILSKKREMIRIE